MPSISLYKLLKVSATASRKDIRKAYFALAKKVHPDKNRDDPKAKERFQALQKAYKILSNKSSRERYDRTGCDEEDAEGFWNAYEKFRGVKVTEEEIAAFEDSYTGSKEEENDLIAFFNKKRGDVTAILSYIIASKDEDIERFAAFFETALEAGTVKQKYRKTFLKTKAEVLTLEELENAENLDNIDETIDQNSSEEEEGGSELDDFIVPDTKAIKEARNGKEQDVFSESSEDEATKALKLKKHDQVKACWKGGNKFYEATITQVHSKNKYDVLYTDGVVEKGVDRSLIKVPGRGLEIGNEKPPRKRVRNDTEGNRASLERKADSSTNVAQSRKSRKKQRASKTAPKSRRAKSTTSSAQPDGEYGDMDALRAAILGKNQSSQRKANFDAFAKKWTS